MQSQQQLILNVRLRDDATLENFFCPPRSEPLLSSLKGQLEPTGEPAIYLCGPPGVGKSHLLQGACYRAGVGAAVYLPLADLASYAPQDVLQGVESVPLVCLDDIQAVAGNSDWEQALFHFYNRARAGGCRLLLSADRTPRELAITLPDLHSRLAWGLVFQLPQLDDDDRLAVLRFRAARRGMQMSPEVASYIAGRGPRALARLIDLLDTLDSASLIEKRALSIPFVKQALGW